ncbi:MAG: metallophosphoesterase family protein, partial [Treponemataceae bacterium]|nr:metallophosphoesterase family protein [Treponemataceae bacterium]
MNSLEQVAGNLIGSQKDVEELARKKHVTLLLVSDSHGETNILHTIINEYGPLCDAMVFCGDGMGEICSYIEEASSDKKMQENLPPVLAIVKGNCDFERYSIKKESSSGQIVEASINCPIAQVFEAAGRQVFVSHGNTLGVNYNTDAL